MNGYVYASPEIETLCGAKIYVTASPENDERPPTLREAIVGVNRDGKAMAFRLNLEMVNEMREALQKALE